MAQPNSAGWWAFEGRIKGGNSDKVEREVVRVHWGTITQRWQVAWAKGRHPASMLVGKWTKVDVPWEQHESRTAQA